VYVLKTFVFTTTTKLQDRTEIDFEPVLKVEQSNSTFLDNKLNCTSYTIPKPWTSTTNGSL